MNVVICTAKEACKLMSHLNDDDMVILSVIDKKTYSHIKPKRMKKKKGEELIEKADDIFYQDNDFFGTLSLYGVLKEKNIIHSILFPQLE